MRIQRIHDSDCTETTWARNNMHIDIVNNGIGTDTYTHLHLHMHTTPRVGVHGWVGLLGIQAQAGGRTEKDVSGPGLEETCPARAGVGAVRGGKNPQKNVTDVVAPQGSSSSGHPRKHVAPMGAAEVQSEHRLTRGQIYAREGRLFRACSCVRVRVHVRVRVRVRFFLVNASAYNLHEHPSPY